MTLYCDVCYKQGIFDDDDTHTHVAESSSHPIQNWRCPSSNPLGAPLAYGIQPCYEAHSDLLAKKSKKQ